MITFASALGTETIEKNLLWLLEKYCTVDHFTFPKNQVGFNTTSANSRLDRILKTPEFNAFLYKAHRNAIPILVHSATCAFHALPYSILFPGTFSILISWLRNTDQLPFEQLSLKEKFSMHMHRAAFSRAHRVIAANATHYRNLLDNYELSPAKVTRAPLPVNLDHFVPDRTSIDRRISRPRVLFVGADLNRKGGCELIQWYRERGDALCELKIVTVGSPPVNLPSGISWVTGVEFGSAEHLRIFQSSDVFCLPSYEDGYGQVLAEAAACGLAIVTTATTLAHSEIVSPGVNGLVAATPNDCLVELELLLSDPERIENMKARSRQVIADRFQPDSVFEQLMKALPTMQSSL